MCAMPQQLSTSSTPATIQAKRTSGQQQQGEQTSSVSFDLLEREAEDQRVDEAGHEHYALSEGDVIPPANLLHSLGWTTETPQSSATPSAAAHSAIRTPQEAGWQLSVVGDTTADDEPVPQHLSPILSAGVINTSPAAMLQTNALLEEVLFDLRYGQLGDRYEVSTLERFTDAIDEEEEEIDDEELRATTVRAVVSDQEEETLQQQRAPTPPIVLGCGPLVHSPSQVSVGWTPGMQSWSDSVLLAHAERDSSSGSSSPTTDSELTARRNAVIHDRSSSGSSSMDSDSDTGGDSTDSESIRPLNDAEMASSDVDVRFERAHVRQITALVQSRHRVLRRGPSCIRLPTRSNTHSSGSEDLSYDCGSEVQFDPAEATTANITEVDSDEARTFLLSPASAGADVDDQGDTRDTTLSKGRSPLETRPISRGVFASSSQTIGARDSREGSGDTWHRPARVLARHPVGQPSCTAQWTSSAVRSLRRVTTTNSDTLSRLPPPLLRGLRRSACSTFWSPHVRLSTAVETVPRVVIDECTVAKEKPKEAEADAEQERPSTPQQDARPLSTLAAPRCYTRPNFRVTIYPRTSDIFQDKSLHERIQSQLIATLTGADTQHAQKQRTRWYSLQRNAPPLSAAPVRPLPDVPGSAATDGSVTTKAAKRRSATYTATCDSDEGHCCGMSSTDVVLDRFRSFDVRGRRPVTIGAAATTRKRTSWQRAGDRDSWVSVTESETSYCSWVSYTSQSSVSSSSSVPAEWRRRVRTRAAVTQADVLERAVPVNFAPSPMSQDALSPGPPSSCLMPPALLAGHLRDVRRSSAVHVPELPTLSPFYIDVYEYWPANDDGDEEETEPALEKWARHQSVRQSVPTRGWHQGEALASVARHLEDVASSHGSHSSDTLGPTDGPWSDNDSDRNTGTCSCDEASSTASSDDSARTLTPPRSDFPHIDSPGLCLHQVVSPLDLSSGSSDEVDLQKGQPPLMAVLTDCQFPSTVVARDVAPLRITKQQPSSARSAAPPQRRPAHRRWILVDEQGKRIEGDRKARGRGSLESRSSLDSGRSGFSSSGSGSSQSGGSADDDVKRRSTESGSSLTESTVRGDSLDKEQLQRTSQHRQSYVMPSSQSQCRDLVAAASMTGIGFDMCSSSLGSKTATMGAAEKPAHRTQPRSILKTGSTRWSEGSGVQSSNSGTHASTLTSRTNSSSTMSVHFHEPVLARRASVAFALPVRSASLSEPQSSSTTTTAGQSNVSSSETLISSLELNGERPPLSQRRQTTTTVPITPARRHNSSSSTDARRRLTSYDLAMRLQREELRRQRNDERLEALDKLEGKSRKSHLLDGLIKSSRPTQPKRGRGFGLGLDGMDGGGTDVERHARYMAANSDAAADDDDAMPTTPLTPTREELRQWEHEWEMTHHVNQFSDNRAQRFTNVIGFDIGIVPFAQQQARKRAMAEPAAASAAANKRGFEHASKTSSLLSSNSSLTKAPLYRQPSDARKRLERELGAGLRKLSVAVEARHAARERYVDQ